MQYNDLNSNLERLSRLLQALPQVIQNSGYPGKYGSYAGSGRQALNRTVKNLERLLVVIRKQTKELKSELEDGQRNELYKKILNR